MRILATITRPTTGRVTWNGVDISRSPDELRSVLGYLPQDFGVYPNLSAVEFLEYLAAAKGLDHKLSRGRIDELLEVMNLAGVRGRRLGGFSGGMIQRVGIAQALLNDPHVLIVDEPTAGLDPEERIRLRNLLSEIAGTRLVILSTHIVSDVEAQATRIAVMCSGSVIYHDAPENLLRVVEGKAWELVIPSEQLAAARERHLTSSAIHRSDGVHVRLVSETPPGGGAVAVMPTLEEAYLFLISTTGKRAA
jgi:ABC-type multidrug transport system ATPase subunit